MATCLVYRDDSVLNSLDLLDFPEHTPVDVANQLYNA